MKRILSLFLIVSLLISVVCLSSCDKTTFSDPARLIDLNDDCVTVQGSGDYTYHPPEETIELDNAEGALFFNNLITVFLTEELSSNEVKELLDYVDGELVGLTRSGVNSLEIKVEESSLYELKEKAESLYYFDCVLFSDYDFPIYPSDASVSNDPWIAGDTPIEDRGNEAHPDGNDWWVEAVGAYTAWDLCENITEKTKVAVVDSGINYSHEEMIYVSDFGNYPNTPSSHGTLVAGVIAAASNNGTGIRGIASDNCEVVSVDIDVDGKDYWSNNEWIVIFSSLVESGNKVINFSQCLYIYSEDFFDKHVYTILADKDPYQRNLFEKYWDWYMSAYVDGSYYQAYVNLVESDAKHYGSLSAKLICALISQGYEDFIFVQGAGNGYDNSFGTPGSDTIYSGYFAAINRETFYSTISKEALSRLNACGIDYDTIASHKMVVAATGKPDANGNYRITTWSSYGDNVDICAPGEDIYHCPSYGETVYEAEKCCDYIDDTCCCEKMGGTSASAPIVSAGVALTWAAFPSASSQEIKDMVISNATVYAKGSTDGDNRSYPMINIGKSVEAALPIEVVLNSSDDEETKSQVDSGESLVYSDVIYLYRNAAENNFFNGDLYACGDIKTELWLSAYTGSDLVYSLVDLCNDGEPELIVAAVDSRYSGGYQIYDIWGQENGVAYRLFDDGSMGYRTIYSVTNNNCLMATYTFTEMWDEEVPGQGYPVQICYNKLYSLTPNSSRVVFSNGFKRELINGGEECYCYHIDEYGNENNFISNDDYYDFEALTGMAWNEVNYNPGPSYEWILICENIKNA